MLRMPAETFDEWRLLFDYEPWGEERMEYLHGFNTAALSGRKKPPAYYMPFVHPPKPEMSGEAMKNIIVALPGVTWTTS